MTYDLGVIRRQRYTTPTYTSLGGIITYYNVGAVQYTAHIFLSGTTSFSVFTTSTVDLLLVGGGASGGPSRGGNGGQLLEIYGATLAVGNYNVTVAAATNNPATSIPGNPTSIVGTTPGTYATTATGGLSSNGVGAGGGGFGADSSPGGPGAISSIITTSIAATYGAGVNSGGSIYFAGGGGAGSASYSGGGSGGIGGGGTGSDGSGNGKTPGTPLTGGGGGGAGYAASAAGGGSGFAMIRYITPIASLIPINDQYFNYVGLLLSNQTLDVTTPTAITSNNLSIEYLIVGGGGAGGGAMSSGQGFGGGGGAGGLIFGTSTNFVGPGVNLIITVGAGGGAGLSNSGSNGNNGQSSSLVSSSIFGSGVGTTSTLIALGGGGGGYVNLVGSGRNGSNGSAGGSGGGGATGASAGAGGAATQSSYTFTTAVGLGYSGGNGVATAGSTRGGGGGGAGGVGGAGAVGTTPGGSGFTWVDGITYAAGGDSALNNAVVNGVRGGGGSGINFSSSVYTGSGGGGAVVIRYSGTNVLATGGTISNVSNYVYHTFDSSGVFSIVDQSTITNMVYSQINYLVVGGGGGGGSSNQAFGGGGGAGGLITGTFTITNLSNLLTISIGAGGTIYSNGVDSSISSSYVTKIAYGGGRGGSGSDGGGGGASAGASGGSGGGGGGVYAGTSNAGGGATQPSSASGGYGNAGGGPGSGSGGGGGAGGAGGNSQVAGPGLLVNTPNTVYTKIYAAGGNGSSASAGTSNTGNGGGGNGGTAFGGSGISIVWEPVTNPWPTIIGNPSIDTTSGYRVYAFTSTGALVFGNSLSNSNITDGSPYRYTIAPGNQPSQGSFNPYSKNWSVFFDGSSSYLQIPNSVAYGETRLNLDSNNFTIEGWVYFNSVASGRIIGHGATNNTLTSSGGWKIEITTGVLAFSASSVINGNVWNMANAIAIGSVVVGKWYHFAVVRIGSQFSTYLNGVAGATASSSAAIYGASYYNLQIGTRDATDLLSGYLSNIRIIRGTGYYTGAFTPSTAPLPIVTNTLLIACASSYLVDKSDYNWPITLGGTPVVKKFSPFSNLGTYNTALLGGSIYFNGSDYLTVISTATTNVPDWKYLHDGTTNYTIEGWVYPTPSTTSTIYTLLGTADSIGGTGTYIGISNLAPIWLVNNGASSYTVRGPTNSIDFNAWNHIAYTFSSTNRITNIYVNGVNVATSTTSASYFNTTSAASYSLTIGRYPSYGSSINASSPYYYQGYMSNFRVAKTTSDSVVPIGLTSGTTVLEYLVVAGGGGAPTSGNGRGGGGGGGFRTGTFITTQSGAIYTITVGSGGNGGTLTPTNGGNSSIVGTFISIISAGGGTSNGVNVGGSPGGSGGGSGSTSGAKSGGAGNTPATVPAQGYDGGSVSSSTAGSGGGGAGGGGGNVSATNAGGGGAGALSNIDGLSYYYAGGGGGHVAAGATGTGGSGGGAGSNYASNTAGRNLPSSTGNGGQNTGGGGWGGDSTGGAGGLGGSGCVIVRYLGPQRAVGGDIVKTNISGYTVHTFLNSGILTDYTSSYTIPGSPILPNTTATNLLLNFTDAVIVDATLQNNVYAYGDTGLSSFTKKYNKMSMYFDGTIDALVISTGTNASSLGAGAFTVEMWIYPLQAYSTLTAPALLDSRTTGNGAGLIRFGFNGTTLSGGPQIAWVENGTSLLTTTLALNTWQHIAVVRNAGTIAIYNNGSQISTASNSTNLTVPFKYIGKSYDNIYWNGYMDDLRITNGIARYTAAFTPPTFKPQLK